MTSKYLCSHVHEDINFSKLQMYPTIAQEVQAMYKRQWEYSSQADDKVPRNDMRTGSC